MKRIAITLFSIFLLCSAFALTSQAEETYIGPVLGNCSIQEGYIAKSSNLLSFYSSATPVSYDRDGAKEAIVAGLENYDETIDLSAYTIPYDKSEEHKNAFLKLIAEVVNENPQLFHVRSGWKALATNEDKIVKFVPYYGMDESEYNIKKPLFNIAVQVALASIDDSMTDLDKIIALHDYLVLNAEYDVETYELGNSNHPTSFSAYGVLVEGMGVCQSYTLALNLLCKSENIEITVVQSEALNHIWNLVKLDGEWYHIDVTYDDPIYDRPGLTHYANFLKTDEEFTTEGSACDHSATDWNKGIADAIADSTTYSDAFWNDAHANMARYNGYYYYAIGVPYPTKLVRSSISDIDARESVYTLGTNEASWYTDDENLIKSKLFAVIPFVYGNELYFNTVNSIYKYNGTAVKPAYTFFEKEDPGFIVPIQYLPNIVPIFARVTKADKESSPYVYSEIASPFILGDVNADGIINSIDIFTLSRHLNSWKGYENITFRGNCDVNMDGLINEDDLKALASLIIAG